MNIYEIYVLPVGIKVCLENRSHKVFYFDETVEPWYEPCRGHNAKRLLTPGETQGEELGAGGG